MKTPKKTLFIALFFIIGALAILILTMAVPWSVTNLNANQLTSASKTVTTTALNLNLQTMPGSVSVTIMNKSGNQGVQIIVTPRWNSQGECIITGNNLTCIAVNTTPFGDTVTYQSTRLTTLNCHLGDGSDTFSCNNPINSTMIFGEGARDYMYGTGNTVRNRFWGGAGDDRLEGGSGPDLFYGEGGNDELWGKGGNDTLYGGANNDKLYGDSGLDYLYGEGGNDELWGGLDLDTNNNGVIDFAEVEVDTYNGGQDADLLYGVTAEDIVNNLEPIDTIEYADQY